MAPGLGQRVFKGMVDGTRSARYGISKDCAKVKSTRLSTHRPFADIGRGVAKRARGQAILRGDSVALDITRIDRADALGRRQRVMVRGDRDEYPVDLLRADIECRSADMTWRIGWRQ